MRIVNLRNSAVVLAMQAVISASIDGQLLIVLPRYWKLPTAFSSLPSIVTAGGTHAFPEAG